MKACKANVKIIYTSDLAIAASNKCVKITLALYQKIFINPIIKLNFFQIRILVGS